MFALWFLILLYTWRPVWGFDSAELDAKIREVLYPTRQSGKHDPVRGWVAGRHFPPEEYVIVKGFGSSEEALWDAVMQLGLMLGIRVDLDQSNKIVEVRNEREQSVDLVFNETKNIGYPQPVVLKAEVIPTDDEQVRYIVCRRSDLFLLRVVRLDLQMEQLAQTDLPFSQALALVALLIGSYEEERNQLSEKRRAWVDSVLSPRIEKLQTEKQRLAFLARLERAGLDWLTASVTGPGEVGQWVRSGLQTRGITQVVFTSQDLGITTAIRVRYWQQEEPLFAPIVQLLEEVLVTSPLPIAYAGPHVSTDIEILLGAADSRKLALMYKKVTNDDIILCRLWGDAVPIFDLQGQKLVIKDTLRAPGAVTIAGLPDTWIWVRGINDQMQPVEGYVFSWFLEAIRRYRKGIINCAAILYTDKELTDSIGQCLIGYPVLAYPDEIGVDVSWVFLPNGYHGFIATQEVTWLHE